LTPQNTPVMIHASCAGAGATPTITLTTPPQFGSVTGWPLVYTPAAGQHGGDHFFFTATNPDTAETSSPTLVSVVTNSRPRCSDGTATTYVGQPVSIVYADLPCSDADGDSMLVHADDGAHGTTDGDPTDGKVTYTPEPGYVGTDVIQFHASDGFLGESGWCDLTITITPAPISTVAATPPTSSLAAAAPAQAPPAPSADRTGPSVTVKAGKASIARGVALTVTSNEAGTAKLTLAAGKTKATKSAKLANGTTKVTLKLSAKARKALKRKRSVKATVTLVASDAAGNQTTRKLSVALRRT
jgi:hypothetical protein